MSSTTRIEMRILLLGDSGSEPGYETWDTSLARAGVPFDSIALADQPSSLSIVRPDGTIRYQALILAKDGLLESALDPEQRTALDALECDPGLRRLTAYAYPGP